MERRRDTSDEREGRSRDRYDDRDSGRGRDRGRDRDDDRGSSRGRDRDDDRGSRRRDDDDRGSRRGGSGYTYEPRSAESVRKRAQDDSKFDKLLKPHIKMWTPNDGDNNIRIVPPTWAKPEHFAYDIYVHYGVGPDRQSYLCLFKMKGEPDPINDERERFRRDMDSENKDDKEYLKELTAKQRGLIYLIDRDNEKEGVQAWAMPHGLDMDIVKVSVDKQSGEVLPIDHPEDGYDIFFEKNGKGINTKYEGVAIARRSSPLGKAAWLDFAVENPLPDQLQYFDYDYIAKAFGGGGAHKESDRGGDRDRDNDRGRDRDRDDDRRGNRERDNSAREDDRNDRRERDREERGRSREEPELTWESIHSMKPRELEDLIEQERLKINPKEAKDDEDLADWICEEMKLKKAERSSRRASIDDDEGADRLRRMRERRGD
jgi:hypothetical protein